MEQKLIQWLPLLVTFTAGMFALFQIRSNNITNARIRWLENLKQVLTEFLSECATLQLKKGVSKEIDERGKEAPVPEAAQVYYNKISEETIDHLKTIEAKHDLIKLSLNPKEEVHQKLDKLLDEYMELFNKIPTPHTTQDYNALLRKMSAYSNTIVLLVRYIMKLEWEKTKRLYLSRYIFMNFGKGERLLAEALGLKFLPERPPQDNGNLQSIMKRICIMNLRS